MRIEPATTADVDRLTDLWVALAEDQRQHGSHLAAEGNREAMRRAIATATGDDRIVVARPENTSDEAAEKRVAGFVMFILERGLYAQDTTRGRIQNVYVAPDFRDRGLGSALIHRAEEALFDRGAAVISVEAMAENDAVRRLYGRLGYRPHRIEFEKTADRERNR